MCASIYGTCWNKYQFKVQPTLDDVEIERREARVNKLREELQAFQNELVHRGAQVRKEQAV